MRWLLIVLVACGGNSPRHPQRACVSLAEAENEEQVAKVSSRQSLLDEIALHDLTLVTLHATEAQVGDVHENTWRSDGARVLAPITYWGCGPRPESGEFVKSTANELWALVPAPIARTQRTVASCACRSTLAVGQHCGGAAPPPLQLAYDLPAGTTFRGTMPIQYNLDVVSISYADDYPGSRCPPMPPPAP
jgi:hypothetical protein